MSTTATGVVEVRSWSDAYPPFTVGGSLYAVPGSLRLAAAQALVERRCRVHADVILDHTGAHRGVGLAEVTAVRRMLPDARIDVHLISLGEVVSGEGPPDEVVAEEQRVLAEITDLGPTAVTLSPDRLRRHRERLAELRAAGSQVLVEVSPADGPPGEDLGVNGVLVMFIEPGTKGTADLAQLARVAELSPRWPVAVDGGITGSIAAACHEYGAGYLISGRDLLRTRSLDPQSSAVPPGRKGVHP